MGSADTYSAQVLSYSDYYPFGMLMPNRFGSAGEQYRFGFNGKEFDPEIAGNGNQYDYGFRIYNPRIGRFLSVDPLTASYPWYTPYQFAGNKPIWAIDLDGLEELTHQEEMDLITYVPALVYKAWSGLGRGFSNGISRPVGLGTGLMEAPPEGKRWRKILDNAHPDADIFGNRWILEDDHGFLSTIEEKINDLGDVAGIFTGGNPGSAILSKVPGWTKVAFSSANDLVKRALAYRVTKGLNKYDGSEHMGFKGNVAVLEYEKADGTLDYLYTYSKGGGPDTHAEVILLKEFDKLDLPKGNAKRLYSELDPCKGCNKKTLEYENLEKSYSFDRVSMAAAGLASETRALIKNGMSGIWTKIDLRLMGRKGMMRLRGEGNYYTTHLYSDDAIYHVSFT